MSRTIVVVAVAALVMAVGSIGAQERVAAAAKEAGSKTISVDCAKAQSINAALEDGAEVLVVEFTGECHEGVVIPRGSVTLRGTSGDAAIVGPGFGAPSPGLVGVEIAAHSAVALEGFEVTGWINGIDAKDGASVTLVGITSTANSRGLRVDTGASVTVTDSTFDGNERGIQAWSGSTVKLNGTVSASGGGVGVLASNGTSLIAGANCVLVVNDHTSAGMQLQQGSSALLIGNGTAVRVVASGNPTGIVTLDSTLAASMVELTTNYHGARVLDGSHVTLYGGNIAQNDMLGISVGRGASLLASEARNALRVADNAIGVAVESSAFAYLDGLEIADNAEVGLVADGAGLEVWRAQASGNGIDATLSFGARVDFLGGNSFGTVTCDTSVIVRGDVGCPQVATVSALGARGQLSGGVRRGATSSRSVDAARRPEALLP